MMLLDAEPRPPTAVFRVDGEHCGPYWSPADVTVVALSLFTTWATRTGRTLPGAPITVLSPEEIMDFWIDDQLEEPYASAAHPAPAVD